MNDLNSSNQKNSKLHAEYFVQLVQIAISNSIICSSEMELLHRMGKKMGINDLEIDTLIEKTLEMDYVPPEKLSARFEMVYGLVKMTMADGSIDKNEMQLVNGFIAKAGFSEKDIPNLLLLLIRGIRQNKNAVELFKVYNETE
jgi:uncharacterized tellurite resistance protein B-like protein